MKKGKIRNENVRGRINKVGTSDKEHHRQNAEVVRVCQNDGRMAHAKKKDAPVPGNRLRGREKPVGKTRVKEI